MERLSTELVGTFARNACASERFPTYLLKRSPHLTEWRPRPVSRRLAVQLGELLVATTVFEAKPDRAQDATQEQTTAEADRYLQKESALLDPI